VRRFSQHDERLKASADFDDTKNFAEIHIERIYK